MTRVASGSEGEKIAKEISEILGLKHCRKLDIHMKRGEIFTVEAEFYLDQDGALQLPALFQEYELIPKGEPKELHTAVDISCMNDEVDKYEFKVIK